MMNELIGYTVTQVRVLTSHGLCTCLLVRNDTQVIVGLGLREAHVHHRGNEPQGGSDAWHRS